MRGKHLSAVMLVAMLLSASAGANTILSASDAGWYESTGLGFSLPSGNYLVGNDSGIYFRDFFVFDLTGVAQTITSAKLSMETSFVYTSDPFETYELFDASTAPATLIAGTGGTAAYNDLGSGTSFGSRNYTTAEGNTIQTITLNAAFVSAANAARGGLLAFGGAITTLDANASTNEEVFGYSGSPTPTLILNPSSAAVPMPIAALSGLALLAVLAASRLRHRQTYPA